MTTSLFVGTVRVPGVHRIAFGELPVSVHVPVRSRTENPLSATAVALTVFWTLLVKVTVPTADGFVQI